MHRGRGFVGIGCRNLHTHGNTDGTDMRSQNRLVHAGCWTVHERTLSSVDFWMQAYLLMHAHMHGCGMLTHAWVY